jgi:hypothetical protein
MFCSPVGNQNMFFGKNRKANVVLSGFCTAPSAGIEFLKSLNSPQSKDPYASNLFNTTNMKRGINTLLCSIGIKYNDILEISKDEDRLFDENIRFLMTQILCTICAYGSSASTKVSELIENDEFFTKQVNSCIACWIERIECNLEKNGTVLIMGNDAFNLIKKTTFDKKRRQCKINFGSKTNDAHNSVLAYLKEQGYEIFKVYHASALTRENIRELWFKNDARKKVHKHLFAKFGEENISPTLPTSC